MTNMNIKYKKGFSLLELLIAMVIMLVLASVAYPAYQHHLVRARRNQVKITLMNLASELESYYTRNQGYQGATLDSLGLGQVDQQHYYQLTIISSAQTYLITAVPQGKQATADTLCGSLSLDELGRQSISGVGNVVQCW